MASEPSCYQPDCEKCPLRDSCRNYKPIINPPDTTWTPSVTWPYPSTPDATVPYKYPGIVCYT